MNVEATKRAVRDRVWALLDEQGAVEPPGAKKFDFGAKFRTTIRARVNINFNTSLSQIELLQVSNFKRRSGLRQCAGRIVHLRSIGPDRGNPKLLANRHVSADSPVEVGNRSAVPDAIYAVTALQLF